MDLTNSNTIRNNDTIIEDPVYIRISNNKNNIYDYRVTLARSGFTFNKRAYGKSFYELSTSEKETPKWENFAKRAGLRIDVIPYAYARDTEYRNTYFKNNKPAIQARYRCAYCGKVLLYKDTTIDHIFPVNKLSYNKSVRNRAKTWGINGANEELNLVPACRKCNSKKSTKMGVWIYKGFIGKSEKLWIFRKVFRIIALATAILFIGCVFAGKLPKKIPGPNELFRPNGFVEQTTHI